MRRALFCLLVCLLPVSPARADCDTSQENLLDVSRGGRIVAASSYHWAASIDRNSELGDHGIQLKPENRDTVIYAFRDGKWARFGCLTITLPALKGSSVPTIELATAQEKPGNPWRMIGQFRPRPEYLQGEGLKLSFAPVTARFLRMRVLGTSAEAPAVVGEVRLHGQLISDSAPPPLPVRRNYDSNLIGLAEGGRVAKATTPGWEGVIDGREAFAGPFPMQAEPQAAFALAGGERLLTGFSVYIPQASRHNPAKIEVLAGSKGAEGEFTSLGVFDIDNLRYFHDPLQYFDLPDTRATHIWILPLATHGDKVLYLREIRVHGK